MAEAPVVGVVGSGHAGMAATRKLVERGIRPIVLDVGEDLDRERRTVVERLRRQRRTEWAAADVAVLAHNPTVTSERPRRLAFGSDYVYGGDRNDLAFEESSEGPRPSYARGGFSNVWGAAMLPADDCDLGAWPFRRSDLAPYYEEVLRRMPFSAVEDGLARRFPLYRSAPEGLELPPAMRSLLDRLSRSRALRGRDDVAFGQARLAVRARDGDGGAGCSYCGYCLSGCVYGSIYTATEDLTRCIRAGQVDYRPGRTVLRLRERGGQVEVLCRTDGGDRETVRLDRVFLAAGAIGSTRIILESKRLYDRECVMQSSQGFVLPMVQLRAAPFVWPKANTLAGVFLDFKIPGVSEHWVHSQINSANELVMQRLDFVPGRGRLRDVVLKMGFRRLLIANTNFHSDHAGRHYLTLRPPAGGEGSSLSIETRASEDFARVARSGARQLTKLMLRAGVVPLLPMIQAAYGKPWGWHFGGSMPMSKRPQDELDTDLLGRPVGYRRVHVVDSSVFPSMPATTVVLPAMANARRIVASVEAL